MAKYVWPTVVTGEIAANAIEAGVIEANTIEDIGGELAAMSDDLVRDIDAAEGKV